MNKQNSETEVRGASAVEGIVRRTVKPDPWWEFDFYWNMKVEELRREVWKCKGFLTGDTEPYPLDLMREKLVLDMNEKIIEELMGVPDNFLGKRECA